ncbi:germination protein, Ger(x)C family [Carboxydocella sporoproducens DSM 16521]|uniref:Germination protein, Ger(X)C family n=2 Tax=Carboxydocella TaxID=178898 RepID=A0A1T4RVD5_9FIRM|nr:MULTISPECIES: Ger(x)C family spore germination protein [Carboxydocella]AVX19998.1 germination protein, Ger(x)C family [Carboxydocella thermautotrophica]SKA19708.1 germination protein, Ger(x)C family [Carboxydocella sporoproducens DSM 16521]
MKGIKTLALGLILLITSGCWDARPLEESTITLSVGIDRDERGRLLMTTVAPVLEEDAKKKVLVVSTLAHTPRQARMNLDRMLPNPISGGKLQFILIGEEQARNGIRGIMDVFFRDPGNPSTAYVGVVEGKAQELFMQEYPDKPRISLYLASLVKHGKGEGKVIPVTVQRLRTMMYDEGQDTFLPYFRRGAKEVSLAGTALFIEDKFKTVLPPRESAWLSLVNGDTSRIKLTMRWRKDELETPDDFLSVCYFAEDRDFKVHKGEGWKVEINLKTRTSLEEVPWDLDLSDKKTVKKIQSFLSQEAQREIMNMLRFVQKVPADVLGVGQRIRAEFPREWEKMDWRQEFPRVKFQVKVQVDIARTGLTK